MWQHFLPNEHSLQCEMDRGNCVTAEQVDLDHTNKSSNVLCDASCFHGCHLGFPQAVQQGCFAMIHVSQDGDNWGPWGQHCWVCRRSGIAAKTGLEMPKKIHWATPTTALNATQSRLPPPQTPAERNGIKRAKKSSSQLAS